MSSAKSQAGIYRLSDTKYKTRTQRFIDNFNNLKNEGALDEEKIFETALEQLNQKSLSERKTNEDTLSENTEDHEKQPKRPTEEPLSQFDLKDLEKHH